MVHTLAKSFARSKRRPLACEMLESRQLLAVFTVTTTGDSGLGTLRHAVVSANAFPTPDTIEFAPSLANQTINLTSGPIEITSAVEVDGVAAEGITIDAGGSSRVFNIHGAYNGVELRNLTITGGDTNDFGGGIDSDSPLVLRGVNVSGNTAGDGGGGINQSAASLTIHDSNISGNLSSSGGGAIEADGSLYIYGTSVDGNTSRRGVAIHKGVNSGGSRLHVADSSITNSNDFISSGERPAIYVNNTTVDVQVLRTTLSGNAGGGLRAGSILVDFTGSVLIEDSTISGNDGVGLSLINYRDVDRVDDPPSVVVRNTTISGHDYGVSAICNTIPSSSASSSALCLFESTTITGNETGLTFDGRVTVGSSILSGNVTDVSDAFLYYSSRFFSDGFNVVGTVDSGVILTSAPTDQMGVLDPQLGELRDNGGPTLTHALLLGSPAIDSGAPNPSSAFDQRGAPYGRAFDGDGDGDMRPDAGAFELQLDQSAYDFTADGAINADDIDALLAQIGAPFDPTYDVNLDGDISYDDVVSLLELLGTKPGDANLDRVVDGGDFVIWNNNKFSQGGGWAAADFDGSGNIDGRDFVIWNSYKFGRDPLSRHTPNLARIVLGGLPNTAWLPAESAEASGSSNSGWQWQPFDHHPIDPTDKATENRPAASVTPDVFVPPTSRGDTQVEPKEAKSRHGLVSQLAQEWAQPRPS